MNFACLASFGDDGFVLSLGELRGLGFFGGGAATGGATGTGGGGKQVSGCLVKPVKSFSKSDDF